MGRLREFFTKPKEPTEKISNQEKIDALEQEIQKLDRAIMEQRATIKHLRTTRNQATAARRTLIEKNGNEQE